MIDIVGVKYTGPKPASDDPLFGSSATWLPGEVRNFERSLAARLLVHADSFAESAMNDDEGCYVALPSDERIKREAGTQANVSAMSREELIHFARLQFNRVVHGEGKSDDQIKSEVNTLMALNNIDLLDEERKRAKATRVVLVGLDALTAPDPVKHEKEPTLVELVAGLDKAELLELAKQEGVDVDKRLSADKVRSLLIDKLLVTLE